MQLWDLKLAIINKSIPHFMIFTGEERTLLYSYINEIEKHLQLTLVSVETIAEAYNSATSKSLISTKAKLFLVRDDKSFLNDSVLLSKLVSINNYIIVILNNNNKKLSTAKKEFDNYTVSFDKLTPTVLLGALYSYCPVKEAYLKWLAEACSGDYGRCLQELDKVKIFGKEANIDELFAQFARDGIIHCEIPDCIFDFSNAVLKRDINKAYSLWEDLKLRGDSAIQIFTILYNNFRNLMLVQLSVNPTKESIGLEAKQINGIKWNCGKYTSNELVDILLLISKLDLMIKQGVIVEEVALDYFLAKVM